MFELHTPEKLTLQTQLSQYIFNPDQYISNKPQYISKNVVKEFCHTANTISNKNEDFF